ncbi:hypothetical protein NDU88_002550 [Pleurodeles waltl]|uniref:Uncharacterized protein n=1 Tax=Pleurodeles waltl TaxID=8319 RepID=A0AAV7M0X1_PLEWA|nr:hypothetical protein NDU88_002550 [Pleurodeles waltl]
MEGEPRLVGRRTAPGPHCTSTPRRLDSGAALAPTSPSGLIRKALEKVGGGRLCFQLCVQSIKPAPRSTAQTCNCCTAQPGSTEGLRSGGGAPPHCSPELRRGIPAATTVESLSALQVLAPHGLKARDRAICRLLASVESLGGPTAGILLTARCRGCGGPRARQRARTVPAPLL